MTEKVKLPKAVCDVLDELLNTPYKNRPDYIIRDLYVDNELFDKYTSLHEADSILDIMRALVLGYEPELTPEERIKERYKNGFRGDSQGIFRAGIREALQIHGIKYNWLEGDVE